MEYPMMLKAIDSSLVVCFSNETTGHVAIANQTSDIGYYSSLRTKATDSMWEPYVPSKPKKTVYEWLISTNNNNWFISDVLYTEEEMAIEYKTRIYRKTGGSFEVEVN